MKWIILHDHVLLEMTKKRQDSGVFIF